MSASSWTSPDSRAKWRVGKQIQRRSSHSTISNMYDATAPPRNEALHWHQAEVRPVEER
jgi:hypothetical protein